MFKQTQLLASYRTILRVLFRTKNSVEQQEALRFVKEEFHHPTTPKHLTMEQRAEICQAFAIYLQSNSEYRVQNYHV